MRALIIGALGLSLIGCSHPLPPQAGLVSCSSPSDRACPAGQQVQPMWMKAPYAAADTKPARAEPSSAHLRMRLGVRPGMRLGHSPRIPLPPSPPRRLAVNAAMAKAKPEDAPPAEPQAILPPAAVATAGAEPLPPSGSPPGASQLKASAREGTEKHADRIEPARNNDAAKPTPAPSDNPDLLVAVVMARPDTKSVADLAGKTVAIDDRYAKSSGMVRTAIVAAGAPKVQLSEGSTAAINRLINGEVPAAVVALLASDATETFPDIKGFAIFHVPLSPHRRAPRGRDSAKSMRRTERKITIPRAPTTAGGRAAQGQCNSAAQ